MMSEPLDLEISLSGRDQNSYTVELRVADPKSPRTPERGAVPFDGDLLRRTLHDPIVYGQRLFDMLFAAQNVRRLYDEARAVAQQERRPLRLRLFIHPDAEALHSTRWETLYDPRPGGGWLLARDDIRFSRFLPNMSWEPVAPLNEGTLRTLVVIANPTDLASGRFSAGAGAAEPLAPLDVAGEQRRAREGLGDLFARAEVLGSDPDRPGQVTLDRIRERLREGRFDAVYLACHGALRAHGAQAGPQLLLEKPDGSGDFVAAAALVHQIASLAPDLRPRLVVLASCQSAGSGEPATADAPGALAAVGPLLAQAGVPAVLAMQGSVTMATVGHFIVDFFKEVRKDGQVDRAVAVARGAVAQSWDSWMPVLYLRLPPLEAPRRVPWLAPPAPEHFVPRPSDLARLRAAVLAAASGENEAGVVALRGPGGFGKTTLAEALCQEPEVRAAFPDGILWVTLGEAARDPAGQIADLLWHLTGERPTFGDAEQAGAALGEALAERRVLLVVDDVWEAGHLSPFLRGGPRCVRLVTARERHVLPAAATMVELDVMQAAEATALLGHGLTVPDPTALSSLARRLCYWPTLLRLVNGALRELVGLNESLETVLAYVDEGLSGEGFTAFDLANTAERERAVGATVQVSLRRLEASERERYAELAVFPDDLAIPLAVVNKLWGASGGLTPFRVKRLCLRLLDLSLVQEYDPGAETIRLHDVLRTYLQQTVKPELPALHARLLDAYARARGADAWSTLPPDEPYL